MSISHASIDAPFEAASAPKAPEQGIDSPPTEPSPPVPPTADRVFSPQQQIPRILGLSVPMIVTLAERELTVESILEITVGTIIEFEVPFDAELTLQVANRPIAQGQAVKVGENFGLRITAIGGVADRINALSGGSEEG